MRNINSEAEFENHVRRLIQQYIIRGQKDLILFDSKKAVDIMICRNNNRVNTFFIEIKYHKIKHGRLGFGQGSGAGFQPEILLKRPHFFENNLRWIIGSEDKEVYYLFNNSQLITYIQGGSVGTKFNGIQKRLFKEKSGINRIQLIEELKNWLNT